MLHERLQALMNQKKMTITGVSKLSGVPETTVRNIVTGKTPDPGLQNVVDIVKAMHGSLDEIVGIERPPVAVEPPQPATVDQNVIHLYERSLANKNAWIKRLFFTCCSIVGAVFVLAFIGVLHGAFDCIL